jgi:hypothetical protein
MAGASKMEKLYSVISEYSKLTVEDYQRTYSWGEEQIDEFFDDLYGCVENPSDRPHFFGTLILQSGNTPGTATVVDGQQRLTTVFIYMAKLRDVLSELENRVLDKGRPVDVQQKVLEFLCSSEDRGDDYRFESISFLRKYMIESVYPLPEFQIALPKKERGNSRLFMDTLPFRKAVNYIRKRVDNDFKHYSPEAKLERINTLINALRDKFTVLRVEADSIDQSLELFLTLNNRGMDLGPSDLVKGEIMRFLGDGKTDVEQKKIQQEILKVWHEFTDTIGDIEVFMRHYLLSISDKPIQKRKVHQTVMKHIEGDGHSSTIDKDVLRKSAQKFWDDLVDATTYYGKIIRPAMGGDNQYHLTLLEGLMKSHRSVLLTVMKHVPVGAEQDELIRLVFVLAFRWVFAKENAQKLENLFQGYSTDLRNGLAASTVIMAMNNKANDIKVNLDDFFDGNADSYGCRALLYAVNMNLMGGQFTQDVMDTKVSLQLVAPLSPTKSWQTQVLYKADPDEDYTEAVTQIGNATLLESTSVKGDWNKSFSDKRNVAASSNIAITTDLANIDEWTLANIKTRTEWLFDSFEKLFGVEKFDGQLESFYDYYLEKVTS